MKLSKAILTLIVGSLFSLSVNAQYNKGFKNYKGEFIKSFKVGVGWNFVETDQKPFYLLDGFGGWAGGSIIPNAFHIEKRFDPHFRLNLGMTFSKYIPRSVSKYKYETIKDNGTITLHDGTVIVKENGIKQETDRIVSYDDKSNYIGLDANFLYNFRAFKYRSFLRNTWTLKNLHKEKFYFDGYFLAGLGLYNPVSIPTFNTGVGGDFWITYQWGINFQSVAKWSLNENNRFHMIHSVGVVFHLDQGNDAGALGALRKRQSRKRKKIKPVIPQKPEEYPEDDGSFE